MWFAFLHGKSANITFAFLISLTTPPQKHVSMSLPIIDGPLGLITRQFVQLTVSFSKRFESAPNSIRGKRHAD